MASPFQSAGAALPVESPAAVSADALIEVLHRLQEHRGWLDRDALRRVARQLRLPLSHVYGVASFYHLFLLQRPAPHRCCVCLGTACFVRGGLALARLLESHLGVELDGSGSVAGWSLQRLGCLGACGQAPVLVVDDRLFSHVPVEAEALATWLREAGLPAADRPGEPVRPATAADPQP